ncbi:hypothetical protein ACFVYC_21285 [Pseudarthrobacter sp. NPDC058329]|uniref:hypothetical protein n=1 Tax=Pseudarthrobacter sp. NPDC058329 TaxID=3346448 RepID=UPI0036D94F3E
MTLNRATPRQHGDWSLLINALVEIRQNGQVIRTGFVEEVMPDSSVLWLAADRDNPRQMFEGDCLNNGGSVVGLTRRALPGGKD